MTLPAGPVRLDVVTRLGVAKEVGADALLGRVVRLELGAPVGGTANAEGSGLAGHVVSVTGGRDGIQTNGVGLAVLLALARGDDSPGLSLPVGHVTIMVHNDVASLSGSLGADDALGRDNLGGEGSLVLEDVDGDGRLIIVRFSLEEVLLSGQGGAKRRLGGGREGRSGGNAGREAEGKFNHFDGGKTMLWAAN